MLALEPYDGCILALEPCDSCIMILKPLIWVYNNPEICLVVQ